jgi:hypothetical protein
MRYQLPIAQPPRPADSAGMKKHILLSALWGYVGWYAGAMVAAFLGLNEALGPTMGAFAVVVLWAGAIRAPRFDRSNAQAGHNPS